MPEMLCRCADAFAAARRGLRHVLLCAMLMAAPFGLTRAQGPGTLDIYVLDTDGGESVLYVAPTGEALLFDTGGGNPEASERDFNRILALVELTQIPVLDYVIISHFHGDHVGAAAHLPRLPVRNIRQILDHGAYITELQPERRAAFEHYLEVRNLAKARRAIPGEMLPLGPSVVVHVVASSGETMTSALPGAGAPNPLCAEHTPKRDLRAVENDEVVSVVVRYGEFAFLELADMIWNHEQRLACPSNLLGSIDVYHTSGHGTEWGSNPVLVHAVRPRVAVMNNAAVKGGHADTFATLRSSPGLEDVWQAHFSMQNAAAQDNSPEQFIANLDAAPGHIGHHIKFSARPDGSFTVTNSRNGFKKEYRATVGAR
jgi:competence protein ComEC